MEREQLIELAREAGKYLYGVDLVFTEDKYLRIINTTTSKELAELSADQEIPEEDVCFATYDYVFYPNSGRYPTDVADKTLLVDPWVYDEDGNCYFYSGEADAIYIMKKDVHIKIVKN